jgi:hypothetical protein
LVQIQPPQPISGPETHVSGPFLLVKMKISPFRQFLCIRLQIGASGRATTHTGIAYQVLIRIF